MTARPVICIVVGGSAWEAARIRFASLPGRKPARRGPHTTNHPEHIARRRSTPTTRRGELNSSPAAGHCPAARRLAKGGSASAASRAARQQSAPPTERTSARRGIGTQRRTGHPAGASCSSFKRCTRWVGVVMGVVWPAVTQGATGPVETSPALIRTIPVRRVPTRQKGAEG